MGLGGCRFFGPVDRNFRGVFTTQPKINQNTHKMSHKHYPKEARIRAVQQQDSGRAAAAICKEMNITPSTLKRWRDQLHMLASPDAAKMQEQDKTIEHLARVVADQAVRMRIMG